MARIRILVVEDSLSVRSHLVEVLGGDPGLEVVGEAVDGQQAASMCRELRPDVVTMDLAMPVMDGLEVTEDIMAHCPTPILIISGSYNRGELFRTYDALKAGAIELLEKPRGDEPEGEWERDLLAKVKLVSRIKVITHLRGRMTGRITRPLPEPVASPALAKPGRRTVAIGTSTGGPAALAAVLGSLRTSFPLPILAVIHIGRNFAASFAQWLGKQTPLPVSLAVDGELLAGVSGRVVIAPSDVHLVVRGGRLRLTEDAPVQSCRPSVDVLFSSLAGELGDACVASLLTGMGRDGAQGLLAIRRAGGHTIAQDEASSVVFGMPHEAIAIGAAELILPLSAIGPHLERVASQPRPERLP
jgi:two-component system, chemotaxis family, protein-glutamate methylesterase/glutaminase